MRRWHNAGLIVAVVMWAAESLAQDPSQLNGNAFLSKCTAALRALDAQQGNTNTMTDFGWCMGYILGFVEGHTFGVHQIRAKQPGVQVDYEFCTTGRGVSIEQLARVLVAWLRAHPALLHLPISALTTMALVEAFPCPSSFVPPEETSPSSVARPPSPKTGKGKQ